tara:strand:+ start:61 stop:693 length:633 start_codon:yes stop_codon:yes gene_type:complete
MFKTVRQIFFRKELLSERKLYKKKVGYARACNGEIDYLNKQIYDLNNVGCSTIFSEVIDLFEEEKPQLLNALKSLSKGDVLILDKLDRAFKSKNEFLGIVNQLFKNGINLKILSGGFDFIYNYELLYAIFFVLGELENLEKDIASEKKKNINNAKITIQNLGGRPKLSQLKESLVLRLRNEGYSYRSIKSQTGVALSTIRRIIIDSEANN